MCKYIKNIQNYKIFDIFNIVKKIREDGTVQYYYYQKKIGRHKKRGKKKRKKLRGRRWQETWDYKIMRFDFRRQATYIGVYHDLDEVYYVRKILEERNEQVVFPKKFTNNGNKDRKLYEFNSEYVILKRVEPGESNVTQLRNEYGKFVDHFTTNENWSVFDKFPCLVEETFWVYGYNPKCDRKDFNWIFSNLVVDHDKVIFKYEDDFEFVICKNVSDAIRMYNLLEEKTKRVRNVIMTGATNTRDGRGKVTIDMLSDKTGWTRRKITSKTTRS